MIHLNLPRTPQARRSTPIPRLRHLPYLFASLMLFCVPSLSAQTAPTITVQPVSQTNLVGTTVSLSVVADGTGPLIYQWRLNGTNLPGILTTAAGTNASGYSGDGGAATVAKLCSPEGVTMDPSGNLFIADTYNHLIRKVDTNGIITKVAGGGPRFGDGGAAINCTLNQPLGVALDLNQNLYIADTRNGRVRKVDTNGIITTVAGNGSYSFAGDGGLAINAGLFPSALALDLSGNLFIADYSNSRIRRVGTNGIITTVAGGGSNLGDGSQATNANLSGPTDVAFDGSNNLYIVDYGHNRIRRLGTDGIITTVAGTGTSGFSGDGGTAINADLQSPDGVAVDILGNLYLADTRNFRIRRVDPNGIITTVAGTGGSGFSGDGGTATSATLGTVLGITLDSMQNLYLADASNNRIRRLWLTLGPSLVFNNITPANAGDYSVVITSPYGSVTSQAATLTVTFPPVVTTQPLSRLATVGSGSSFSVTAVGLEPFRYLWYFNETNLIQNGTNSTLSLSVVSPADAGSYRVVVTNLFSSVTSQVATLTVGFSPTLTAQPSSLTNLVGTTPIFSVLPGGTGPFSYQWRFNGTNLPNNITTTVAGNGTSGFSGDGGSATNAGLKSPIGVVVDASGSVYIADARNNRVRRVDTNGIITTVAGNGSTTFSGDGGQATNASLFYPSGMAFDSSGSLYISDRDHYRIRKVTTNGIISTVAGISLWGYSGDGGAATNARLYLPYGVGFDAFGNLHIADNFNSRVRKIDANGIITTVAGGGSGLGDGGQATNANVSGPWAIASDPANNLYISDNNNRVRGVNSAGIISTVAGNGTPGYSGDGGAATNASIGSPAGVCVDFSGNLYVADPYYNRIRKVDPDGIITSLPVLDLSAPEGLGLDLPGNLYVVDYGHNIIRKIALAGFPSLSVSNVAFKDAGDYSVVITSPYGSITSAVATLTITLPPPPQLLNSDPNFGFLSNQFGFNLSGVSGQRIVVEASTNFLDWFPVSTNTFNGTPIYFFDPGSFGFPWRFYRARSP